MVEYIFRSLFTFGRASAKISSAKAKENATRMSIGIEKSDDTRENEIVNIVQSSQNTREELISSFFGHKGSKKNYQ